MGEESKPPESDRPPADDNPPVPPEAAAAGINQSQWDRAQALVDRGDTDLRTALAWTVGSEKASRYEKFSQEGIPATEEEAAESRGYGEVVQPPPPAEPQRTYMRSDERRAGVAQLVREAMESGDPAGFWQRADIKQRAQALGMDPDKLDSLE